MLCRDSLLKAVLLALSYLQSQRPGLGIVWDAPTPTTHTVDPTERIAVRMQPRSAKDALPHIDNSAARNYGPIACSSNEARLLRH